MGNHPNLNTAIRVAIAMMALRLVLFFVDADFPWQEYIYIFLLLAAVPGLAIYAIWPRGNYHSFLEDLKKAAGQTLLYGVLISVFLYFYYSFVDVDFFANRQELIIERELAAMENGNRDDIAEQVKSLFSVRNGSVLTLAGMVLMGVFYAIFFAAAKRLILRSKTS